MAHMLHLAGIDWVILERASTVTPETGVSIALWPHCVRLLDQFGLLEEASKMCDIYKDKYNLNNQGKELAKSQLFQAVEDK